MVICFVEAQRRLRDKGEAARQRARGVHQLVVRHDLVDHADAQRLLGIEVVAGQRPAVGRFPAAQRGEQEARVGDVAHLGLGEHRLVGRDGDVGGELVPEAAAHRPAVDRRDDRLAEPPHVRPRAGARAVLAVQYSMNSACLALRIGMARAALGGLPLVVAGAERRPRAGENDHLDCAVRVGLVEQAVQLGLERLGERVHPLGAIERDGRDLLVHAVEDVRPAHGASFWRVMRCAAGPAIAWRPRSRRSG